MARLPILSAREVLAALARAGFVPVGRKGSHIRLHGVRGGRTRVVIVPDHAEVARGTLLSVMRQAGMTREEFLALLG